MTADLFEVLSSLSQLQLSPEIANPAICFALLANADSSAHAPELISYTTTIVIQKDSLSYIDLLLPTNCHAISHICAPSDVELLKDGKPIPITSRTCFAILPPGYEESYLLRVHFNRSDVHTISWRENFVKWQKRDIVRRFCFSKL
jgi:hypothetical protein